jgi:hypothetical protein
MTPEKSPWSMIWSLANNRIRAPFIPKREIKKMVVRMEKKSAAIMPDVAIALVDQHQLGGGIDARRTVPHVKRERRLNETKVESTFEARCSALPIGLEEYW